MKEMNEINERKKWNEMKEKMKEKIKEMKWNQKKEMKWNQKKEMKWNQRKERKKENIPLLNGDGPSFLAWKFVLVSLSKRVITEHFWLTNGWVLNNTSLDAYVPPSSTNAEETVDRRCNIPGCIPFFKKNTFRFALENKILPIRNEKKMIFFQKWKANLFF